MNNWQKPEALDLLFMGLCIAFSVIFVILLYLESWLVFFAAVAVIILWFPSIYGAVGISVVFALTGVLELAVLGHNPVFALLWWIVAWIAYAFHFGKKDKEVEKRLICEMN